jgi:SAM-dependent methyltransferase
MMRMADRTGKDEPRELSWAWYALDGREHPHYSWSDGYFASFPPGSVVADVGCGNGWALQVLLDRGCRGIGTEVDDRCLREARAAGRPVVKAGAESLPIPTGAVDGVVFAGVLPFTEEDAAFQEIARILRPGGMLEGYYLGIGFAVRDLLLGVSLRNRYFGLRALVNTVLMRTVGLTLPGRFGDTVYVSHRRLAELYARHGFVLRRHTPSPRFLGMPVFIYHSVQRAEAAAAPFQQVPALPGSSAVTAAHPLRADAPPPRLSAPESENPASTSVARSST